MKPIRLVTTKHQGPPGPELDGAAQRMAKGHELVTATLTGELSFPAGLSRRRKTEVCNGVGKRCDLDLDFINDDDAQEFGLPPGTRAVLQKCVRAGQYGELVPVKSAEEAMEVATDFCSCTGTKSNEATRKKCARHR